MAEDGQADKAEVAAEESALFEDSDDDEVAARSFDPNAWLKPKPKAEIRVGPQYQAMQLPAPPDHSCVSDASATVPNRRKASKPQRAVDLKRDTDAARASPATVEEKKPKTSDAGR
ncbi:uncharacterized protein MONBRDRAFT_5620 [Monosiga brevicollis MX1]|uniref:Uncharacterized protein n=1 Tax=Monosiga brevicollis TaxID=81824 RepID=A9URZ2_MONBE|nr:uncharacterized protein MONBRDRAFT_5620 [Monosiga brevicollis MX1]EDQ92011.1 predicted protein [Monosiga brevicollis MX1]|eukprot:XP_001743297.1 hypothetical protein [Monosiga brevicollis MX1]